MSLAETLKKNADYVKSVTGSGAKASDRPKVLVVTDSSPEMTGVIEPALGLGAGDACVVRIAGAWGADEGEELFRSVALAIHLDRCREVYVIGTRGCSYCPASRSALRESMKETGLLENLPDGGNNLLDKIRGPSSPESAVAETVSLLRRTLVPDAIPVHGCMLDPHSGALEVIDRDESARTAATAQPASEELPFVQGEFALPELPEIPLPDIPPLDIDSLTEPAGEHARKKAESVQEKKFEYGSSIENRGPIPFADLKKMAPVQEVESDTGMPDPFGPHEAMESMQVPQIRFEVPEGVKIQDTGISPVEMPPVPDATLAPLPDAKSKADITPTRGLGSGGRPAPRKPAPARTSKHTGRRPRPVPVPRPHRTEQERPAVTPIVRQEPAQKPLGERELAFSPDETTPVRLDRDSGRAMVDIHSGYVRHKNSEFPIEPQLQRSLLKVKQFLSAEFSKQERSNMKSKVRRSATGGQSIGETLKVMIGPVLKLGKKRYAVINELLTIKEELPRQDPQIAEALLEEVLSGR